MKLNFELKTSPLDYIVIDDLLSPELVSEVREWIASMNLNDPEYTGGAIDYNGEHIKSNVGSYANGDPHSIWNKIWRTVVWSLGSEENVDGLKESSHLHSILRRRDERLGSSDALSMFAPSHLVSLYNDGTSYESHPDLTHMTFLYWLDEDGADFTGGDLCFTDFGEEVKYKHNRMVIFVGTHWHKVYPVFGHGRMCVSTFLSPPSEVPMMYTPTNTADYESINEEGASYRWLDEGATS